MQTRHALVCAGLGAVLWSCGAPPPPAPRPVPAGPPTDTVRIPLTDLGAKTYYGHVGGLYTGGVNQPPPAHDSAARARRKAIEPLDVNGDEHPFGKYVLLSIGMSNTTQEWCSASSAPPCTAWSFMGRAAVDLAVNRNSLVIVNGAADGQDIESWMSPTSPNYDRIRTARLNPLGLSENQVQAAWVKLATARPVASIPADTADAYRFLTMLGQTLRTLKVRYPNLQLVFLSSRSYGGYATSDLSPEPYAYETGFSVRLAIESQMNEMRGLPANPRVGTLNYARRAAPLVLWGPYLWANGAVPRSDGLIWLRSDFEEDGTYPSQAGETKVAAFLLEFFKTSPYTRCWFVANQYCM
jgi:hypothetical protein